MLHGNKFIKKIVLFNKLEYKSQLYVVERLNMSHLNEQKEGKKTNRMLTKTGSKKKYSKIAIANHLYRLHSYGTLVF